MVLKNYLGDDSWFTPELQTIIINTIDAIQWAISSGRIIERPDLGLLYYPPLYDLYWFISRTVHNLNNQPNITNKVLIYAR